MEWEWQSEAGQYAHSGEQNPASPVKWPAAGEWGITEPDHCSGSTTPLSPTHSSFQRMGCGFRSSSQALQEGWVGHINLIFCGTELYLGVRVEFWREWQGVIY